MTNAQIILSESVRLVEEGKIGTTGRFLIVEDNEGNRRQIPEPETIHTFAERKNRGLLVKKGEHAVASFPIWMYDERRRAKKTESEDENTVAADSGEGRYFMKRAAFFARSQVKVPDAENANPEPLPA